MCQANNLYVIIQQGCGISRLVPVDCGDPLCVECEKRKANERRERWEPVLERMRNPRFMTLTIKNGLELQERFNWLQRSFRKLFDTRLGPRNWHELRRSAIRFIFGFYRDVYRKGDISRGEMKERCKFWIKSLDRFGDTIDRYHRAKDKWPRFRDVCGEGFASLEITVSKDALWHVHRHLCLDGEFIPWPLLVVAWTRATKGEGCVVDIRAIDKHNPKSIKEICKYITKAWDIPANKSEEFRSVVHGVKRVWPLGGAKPVNPDQVCPFCNDRSCRGHMLGQGEVFERGEYKGQQYCWVKEIDRGSALCFVLQEGMGWRSVPLDLIPSAFACHSEMAMGP